MNRLITVMATSGMLAGCAASEPATSAVEQDSTINFTAQEWHTLHTLSPLPDLPVDTTNRYADSQAAAHLGQKLFFGREDRPEGVPEVADR